MILEYAWLVMGILCAGISVHSTLQNGWKESLMAYLITILSFMMYAVRYYRRKKE